MNLVGFLKRKKHFYFCVFFTVRIYWKCAHQGASSPAVICQLVWVMQHKSIIAFTALRKVKLMPDTTESLV